MLVLWLNKGYLCMRHTVGIEKAREGPFCFRLLAWMVSELRPQRSMWPCLTHWSCDFCMARLRTLGCNCHIPVETLSHPRPAIGTAQVPCKLADAVVLPQCEAWGYHRGGGFIPTYSQACMS